MIKKYSVTKEILEECYKKGIQLIRNDMNLLNGTQVVIGANIHFPIASKYELKRKLNSQIPAGFRNSVMGIYELPKLQSLHEYYNIILPNSVVEVSEEESLSDQIRPILEKSMKGRYLITPISDIVDGEFIYLYYPEFTISNTIGESHLIKDMVIKLMLTGNGVRDIQGKRFSFTKQELYYGYSHSHLKTGYAKTDDFGLFCLGNSKLAEFLITLSDNCTVDQFELLLVQLELYLEWESIEGKPYISISKFYTNQASSTISMLSIEQVEMLAGEWLVRLDPDLLFEQDDTHYIVNPGVKDKEYFQLETEITAKALKDKLLDGHELYDYDISTNVYQSSESLWDTLVLPPQISTSRTRDVRDAFNIKPSLYENKEKIDKSALIRRLSPEDLTKIFKLVNNFLTLSHKLNGENDILTEDTNIHNTETAVTDNSLT